MALIRVYDSSEKLFKGNGIKILHPMLAEVTKKDNGDYYAELRDQAANADYYKQGMIIRIPTPWGIQGFRCGNPSIVNNRVECTAWHLSYDANQYIIKDAYAVDKNCNDALNHFNDSTDLPSPFTVISDIPAIQSTRIVRKSLFDAYKLLISTDRYGGHWDRDNWSLGIRKKIGEDRGVVLAASKNIDSFKSSENWSDVCTKILPYTTDGEVSILLDDDVYVTLNESLYDIPYSKVVKFKNPYKADDFETEELFLQETKAWLRKQAEVYLQEHKLPKVSYSVSASISNVSDIGDVIYIKHPKVNVDIKTNVIGIKYDAIRRAYIKIDFGNFKPEIKDIKQDIAAEAKKDAEDLVNDSKGILEKELEDATNKINSILGESYVINSGNEILIVDKLPKETAKYCIRANSAGIGFSQHGIRGPFSSAWSIDGTMDMQQINVINLTASLIKGGVLKLGGVNNSSGTFELYDSSGTLIGLMDKQGLKMYGRDGSYVLLNNEVGFAGFDRNNNKIYWVDKDEFHMKKSVIEEEITLCNKLRFIPISIYNEAQELVNDGIGLVSTVN